MVECRVIGHNRAMKHRPLSTVPASDPPRATAFLWLLVGFFAALMLVALPAHSERDQTAIKTAATLQIQAAAATTFQTPEERIEVRLGDKRLVLPDCVDDFGISFPFNDRTTTQIDCADPEWRGFVQIRLGSGVDVFRYNIPLRAGETLKRSHVTRHTVSGSVPASNPIVVLEDALGLALVQAVTTDEVLLESHFSGSGTVEQASSSTEAPEAGGWVATQIIPRGSRLSEKSFTWDTIEGRIPTDLIPAGAEFAMFEATRNIMPGDKLRLSAVKMAPSVRKNEEIEIKLVRGALTVTNVVRVDRDATVGETIDVINTESGRILKARVVGIGQVELL